MRCALVLSLCLLTCLSCCDAFGFPPRRPIANHIRTTQAPPYETPTAYPGLITTTNLTQYTIAQILHNASLVGNTHNLTYIFNISAAHLGHMPWLEKSINTTNGHSYTIFLPDDAAMNEAKPRWEEKLKEKFNLTSVDLSAIWNSTEHTGNATVEKVMEYTHAGIAWSIVQGNYSLHNLSTENLLPTMLYPNITKFEPFVRLGNNQSQWMRVIKGDNITVYGTPLIKKFPEMTHANRTDVMIVSGSGHNITSIGHIYREILAKNGRIYIVDRAVDFPFNTTEVLKAENATLFLKGITKSGFNDTVNLTPNTTIFVPTDSAIYQTMKDYAISHDTQQKWTPEQMRAILTPYVVNGTYYGKDLNTTSQLHSIGGHLLNISHNGNLTLINGNVSVIQSDILTMNGVIHVINDTFRTLEKQIIETLPK